MLQMTAAFALIVMVGVCMTACGGNNDNNKPTLADADKLSGLYVNADGTGEFYYFVNNTFVSGGVRYNEVSIKNPYEYYEVYASKASNGKGNVSYAYLGEGTIHNGWVATSDTGDHNGYQTRFKSVDNKFSSAMNIHVYGGDDVNFVKYQGSLQDYAIAFFNQKYEVELTTNDIQVDEGLQSIW